MMEVVDLKPTISSVNFSESTKGNLVISDGAVLNIIDIANSNYLGMASQFIKKHKKNTPRVGRKQI